MKKIRKGNIVSRKSYNNDILFIVERVIDVKGTEFAILKGVVERIKADAPVFDLEIVSNQKVRREIELLENKIDARIKDINNKRNILNFGKILHLDGDKKYTEKSFRYYKKRGLNAIVKNVAEYNQYRFIKPLIKRYNPDILVITGHDGMIKNGTSYNDIYNYRNSKYFIKAVQEARKWSEQRKDLVIFAGACQSYYEALIQAGANFASSPGRILIDFMDPIIVAEKVAITDSNKIVYIKDFSHELREGEKSISGIGAKGKKMTL